MLSITDDNFFTSSNYVRAHSSDRENRGDGTDLCQPLAYKFEVVPISKVSKPPSVLMVHPAPSFPLASGLPMVISVRFSEPIRRVLSKDRSQSVTLGGAQASSIAEVDGGRVWVLTFDAKYSTMSLPLVIDN